jgi:hypothetical protein
MIDAIMKSIKSVQDIDLYMIKNCEGRKHTHNPKVNQGGAIECTECRRLFSDEADRRDIKRIFREQYGEFANDKFRELMIVKKLVMKEETQNLQPMLYGYEDDKMRSTSRIFYEQK